jgi:hypothetical protein
MTGIGRSNADSDTVNVKLPAAAKHLAREHPDFHGAMWIPGLAGVPK